MVHGRISKGKEIVLEGVVRCMKCGFTRHETYREWVARTVPLIVSYRETSQRTDIELFPGEMVTVGDRLDVRDTRVEITAIEVQGRRVERAVAEEIEVIWSKRVDRVQVKFSVNRGGKTLPYSLEVPPDEEFEVGDIVDLGKERAVVHRISTTRGLVREGVAAAEEIRRVYCKGIKHGQRNHEPRKSRR